MQDTPARRQPLDLPAQATLVMFWRPNPPRGAARASARSESPLLLRLDEIEKRIGDRLLFRGVSFVVRAGDRIGIVGPNGAGKTTLLRMLAGDEPPDGGQLPAGAHDPRSGCCARRSTRARRARVREEARDGARPARRARGARSRELEAEMSRHGREASRSPPSSPSATTRVAPRYRAGGGFERDARVSRACSRGSASTTNARPGRSRASAAAG